MKNFIFIILLLITNSVHAAVPQIEELNLGDSALSFGQISEQTNDVSARRFPKMSGTNQCALVKVRCPIPGLKFPLSVYEEDKRNGEYWVYYEEGTSEIAVTHPSLNNKPIKLSVSSLEPLKGKVTYSLVVVPSEDMYISQFDERFEDEEDEVITKTSLFGEEFETYLRPFDRIWDDIRSSNVDVKFPCYIHLNDERFQLIRKASDAGWPDATMILMCMLKGSGYVLFEEFRKIDKVSAVGIEHYAKGSPGISEFIENNKASVLKFEKRYKEQVARLEALLAADIAPQDFVNKLNASIKCSPKEYRELQDEAKQYSHLTKILYGKEYQHVLINEMRPSEIEYGLVLEYERTTTAKGSYTTSDKRHELEARYQISPICAKFLDRMRLHRWVTLVDKIQNLK